MSEAASEIPVVTKLIWDASEARTGMAQSKQEFAEFARDMSIQPLSIKAVIDRQGLMGSFESAIAELRLQAAANPIMVPVVSGVGGGALGFAPGVPVGAPTLPITAAEQAGGASGMATQAEVAALLAGGHVAGFPRERSAMAAVAAVAAAERGGNAIYSSAEVMARESGEGSALRGATNEIEFGTAGWMESQYNREVHSGITAEARRALRTGSEGVAGDVIYGASALGLDMGMTRGEEMRENALRYAKRYSAEWATIDSERASLRAASLEQWNNYNRRIPDMDDLEEGAAMEASAYPWQKPTASAGFMGGLGMRKIFLVAAAAKAAAATTEAGYDLGKEAYYSSNAFGTEPGLAFQMTDAARAKMYSERIGPDGQIIRDQDVNQTGKTWTQQFTASGEAAIKSVPLAGPLVYGAGESISRFAQATGNWMGNRGFESDTGYAERMKDVTDEEQRHTKILEDLTDRHKKLNDVLEKETTSLERRDQALKYELPESGKIDAYIKGGLSDIATELAKPDYHFGGNPANALTVAATQYQQAATADVYAHVGAQMAERDYRQTMDQAERAHIAEAAKDYQLRGQGFAGQAARSEFFAQQEAKTSAAVANLQKVTRIAFAEVAPVYGQTTNAYALQKAKDILMDPQSSQAKKDAAQDLLVQSTASAQMESGYDAAQNRSTEEIQERTKELNLGESSEAARRARIEFESGRAITAATGDPARVTALQAEEQAELANLRKPFMGSAESYYNKVQADILSRAGSPTAAVEANPNKPGTRAYHEWETQKQIRDGQAAHRAAMEGRSQTQKNADYVHALSLHHAGIHDQTEAAKGQDQSIKDHGPGYSSAHRWTYTHDPDDTTGRARRSVWAHDPSNEAERTRRLKELEYLHDPHSEEEAARRLKERQYDHPSGSGLNAPPDENQIRLQIQKEYGNRRYDSEGNRIKDAPTTQPDKLSSIDAKMGKIVQLLADPQKILNRLIA